MVEKINVFVYIECLVKMKEGVRGLFEIVSWVVL